jgi:hypothetical protein
MWPMRSCFFKKYPSFVETNESARTDRMKSTCCWSYDLWMHALSDMDFPLFDQWEQPTRSRSDTTPHSQLHKRELELIGAQWTDNFIHSQYIIMGWLHPKYTWLSHDRGASKIIAPLDRFPLLEDFPLFARAFMIGIPDRNEKSGPPWVAVL